LVLRALEVVAGFDLPARLIERVGDLLHVDLAHDVERVFRGHGDIDYHPARAVETDPGHPSQVEEDTRCNTRFWCTRRRPSSRRATMPSARTPTGAPTARTRRRCATRVSWWEAQASSRRARRRHCGSTTASAAYRTAPLPRRKN